MELALVVFGMASDPNFALDNFGLSFALHMDYHVHRHLLLILVEQELETTEVKKLELGLGPVAFDTALDPSFAPGSLYFAPVLHMGYRDHHRCRPWILAKLQWEATKEPALALVLVASNRTELSNFQTVRLYWAHFLSPQELISLHYQHVSNVWHSVWQPPECMISNVSRLLHFVWPLLSLSSHFSLSL